MGGQGQHPPLVGSQERVPGIAAHPATDVGLDGELFGSDLPRAQTPPHGDIDGQRPEFFHQVQCQRRPTPAMLVQEADHGIEPGRFQRRDRLVAQNRVAEESIALTGSGGGRR